MARWVAVITAALIPGTLIPKISGSQRQTTIALPAPTAFAPVPLDLSDRPPPPLQHSVEDAGMRAKDERMRRLRSMGASPEQESLSVNGYVAVQRFRSDDTRFILLWIKCESSWCLVAVSQTPDPRSANVGD